MSGPVPSPSMNGMTGRSGTLSLPPEIVIVCPSAGGVRSLNVGMVGVLSRIRVGKHGENRQRGAKATGPLGWCQFRFAVWPSRLLAAETAAQQPNRAPAAGVRLKTTTSGEISLELGYIAG